MDSLIQKSRLVSLSIYPLTLGSAIGLFEVMNQAGFSLAYSSYLPLILTAPIIIWLEQRYPAAKSWSPGRQDVKTDLTYLVAIQWLLPILMTPLFLMLATPLYSPDSLIFLRIDIRFSFELTVVRIRFAPLCSVIIAKSSALHIEISSLLLLLISIVLLH